MALHILVGTKKAAFIYTPDAQRREWTVSEPLMPGWSIHHMAADVRDSTPRLYAAANHAVWGPSVSKSADGGKTWEARSAGLGFPKDMGSAIHQVWHVRPGLDSEPGVVYAGTSPAGLFRSEDWGASWTPNDAINRHEYRSFWQPIPGGVPLSVMSVWAGSGSEAAQRTVADAGNRPGMGTLHSIELDLRDQAHIYVAISAGGSYTSNDAGQTWQIFSLRPTSPQATMFISQVAARAPAGADPAAEFDMHRMRIDPKNPDRLWAQAHAGVFRSDDGGEHWHDVTEGLPFSHGFPIAVSHREPDAAYIVPLQAGTDNFRVCPGQFAVYRTRDGGATWEALSDGLPGPDDYQSVYREALDTDGLDPEGVFVGTSNGQVYGSIDGGDHWQRLPGTLPPVLSVSCAVF